MKSLKRIFLSGLVCLLAAACTPVYNEVDEPAQEERIPDEPGAIDIILCEEPRPQICTKEYNPVCARLKDGSTRTGATGCTSCSDSEVTGYTMGACGLVQADE